MKDRKEFSEPLNGIVIAQVHPDLPESHIDEMVANYNPALHEAPLTIGHPEDNKPAYNLYEKLGFVKEGVLRGDILTPSGRRNTILMGLLKTDFPYI